VKYLSPHAHIQRPRPPRRALPISVADGISELHARGERRAFAGGRIHRRGGSEPRFLNAVTKPYRCRDRGGRGHGSGEEDAPRGAVRDAGGDI